MLSTLRHGIRKVTPLPCHYLESAYRGKLLFRFPFHSYRINHSRKTRNGTVHSPLWKIKRQVCCGIANKHAPLDVCVCSDIPPAVVIVCLLYRNNATGWLTLPWFTHWMRFYDATVTRNYQQKLSVQLARIRLHSIHSTVTDVHWFRGIN